MRQHNLSTPRHGRASLAVNLQARLGQAGVGVSAREGKSEANRDSLTVFCLVLHHGSGIMSFRIKVHCGVGSWPSWGREGRLVPMRSWRRRQRMKWQVMRQGTHWMKSTESSHESQSHTELEPAEQKEARDGGGQD
eukprot:2811266-Rhodomonas_salina.2